VRIATTTAFEDARRAARLEALAVASRRGGAGRRARGPRPPARDGGQDDRRPSCRAGADWYLSTALFEGFNYFRLCRADPAIHSLNPREHGQSKDVDNRCKWVHALIEDKFQRYARHLILDGSARRERNCLSARVLGGGAGGLARRCCCTSPGRHLQRSVSSTTTGSDLINLHARSCCTRAGLDLKVVEARDNAGAVMDGIKITRWLSGSARQCRGGASPAYLVADRQRQLRHALIADRPLLPFRAQKAADRRGAVAVRGSSLDLPPDLGAGHPCYRCLFRSRPRPNMCRAAMRRPFGARFAGFSASVASVAWSE